MHLTCAGVSNNERHFHTPQNELHAGLVEIEHDPPISEHLPIEHGRSGNAAAALCGYVEGGAQRRDGAHNGHSNGHRRIDVRTWNWRAQ